MDLSNIPEFIITAFITFTGTLAILKYDVKLLKKKDSDQEIEIEKLKTQHTENKDTFLKQRENDLRGINEKFDHTDLKREQLKDELTAQFHKMDKKLTEIHTIIVTKNK